MQPETHIITIPDITIQVGKTEKDKKNNKKDTILTTVKGAAYQRLILDMYKTNVEDACVPQEVTLVMNAPVSMATFPEVDYYGEVARKFVIAKGVDPIVKSVPIQLPASVLPVDLATQRVSVWVKNIYGYANHASTWSDGTWIGNIERSIPLDGAKGSGEVTFDQYIPANVDDSIKIVVEDLVAKTRKGFLFPSRERIAMRHIVGLGVPHTPIIPGTVTITAMNVHGTKMIVKDVGGNGVLDGHVIRNVTRTINYDTGVVEFSFVSSVDTGADVTMHYATYQKVHRFIRKNSVAKLHVSIPWDDFLRIYRSSVSSARALRKDIIHRGSE